MNTTPDSSSRTLSNVSLVAVVTVLLLFIGMQVESLRDQRAPHASHKLTTQIGSGLDDASYQDLVYSSYDAKVAFLSTRTPDRKTPDQKLLRDALKSAEDLEGIMDNAPGTARRVIILRLLLGVPAFAPASKDGPKPANAYTSDLPPGITPKERARYLSELAVWSIADSQTKVPPAKLLMLASTISNTPGIGWWKSPGLMALYQSQGLKAMAASEFEQAQSDALDSVAPILVGAMVVFAMFLVGVMLLIFVIFRAAPKSNEGETRIDTGGVPAFNPWPVVPSPIADNERKLSTNFLWGVFCVYLFMQPFESYLLTGFDGMTKWHLFRFSGFLTSFLPQLHRSSAGTQQLFVVLVSSGVYLFGAFVPMAILVAVARARKASLADELGWHARRLPANIGFGVLGYCVALPVMLVAAKFSDVAFHKAPAPSNPAIGLLVNSASVEAQAILVVLATIAAPFCEEFFFRGVFYQGARQKFGPILAIVLTGCIFGLAHPVGIAEMFEIGVLGCVLAWIAESRKSLASSMIGHCLQNLMATSAALFIVSH